MICSFSANAVTNSRTIIHNVSICTIDPGSIINFTDKEAFDKLCREGCPNYAKKWSCPPFAPLYAKYIEPWNYLSVFLFRTNMSQFSYIKNDYLKIKAANSILKSRADKYLRHLSAEHGIAYISTGSCRLCKPCKCKQQQPCAHPHKMTFSFEAMGINDESLVQKYFNSRLLWYKKGSLPEHTSVICGLLSNDVIRADYLEEQYKNYVNGTY
jgi:predicted metal-binding protein